MALVAVVVVALVQLDELTVNDDAAAPAPLAVLEALVGHFVVHHPGIPGAGALVVAQDHGGDDVAVLVKQGVRL